MKTVIPEQLPKMTTVIGYFNQQILIDINQNSDGMILEMRENGIGEAPFDNDYYLRKQGEWVKLPSTEQIIVGDGLSLINNTINFNLNSLPRV